MASRFDRLLEQAAALFDKESRLFSSRQEVTFDDPDEAALKADLLSQDALGDPISFLENVGSYIERYMFGKEKDEANKLVDEITEAADEG